MQSFIIPLLFIICLSGTVLFLSKRRFEEVLPLSLMIGMLIIFVFAYFDNIKLGFYLTLLVATAFPVIIIFRLIKQKKINLILGNLFTPAFFIFIIIYTLIFFLNYNRGFTVWDEISHWGPMVKEMLRLDKLYSVPESALAVHKDYPPIVPIFEYLWCKLSGGFREAYVYRSLQTLSLSLFFPALCKFKWKKNIKIFPKLILISIFILSVCLLINVGEANFYKTIYIDCFLGLMLAYCLSLIYYEKKITKFGILRISVALSILLLTKQMGLVFFILTLSAFGINYLIVNKDEVKRKIKLGCTKKNLIQILVTILLITVIPYLFVFMWNLKIDSLGLERQFYISKINIPDLIGIVRGISGEDYQQQSFTNFINTFISTPFLSRPIVLTYWQVILIVAIIFILLSKYGKKYFEKYQIDMLCVIVIFGSIAYSFAMLLLYLFCFSVLESIGIMCFTRYMGTYLFAAFTLASMIYLFIEGKKDSDAKSNNLNNIIIILFFIWGICFSSESIYNLKPALDYNSSTSVYIKDAEVINANTEEDSSIYVISQRGCFVGYGLSYLIMPRELNTPFQAMSLGVPYCVGNDNIVYMSVQELSSEFSKYDYVYLHQIDEYFLNEYSSLFSTDKELKNGQLYKISNNLNNTVTLDLIAE